MEFGANEISPAPGGSSLTLMGRLKGRIVQVEESLEMTREPL